MQQRARGARRPSVAGDAFVVAVLVLVALPVLLLTAAVPWLGLVLAGGLLLAAWRWPVAAGPIPRIVTGLLGAVALLAGVLALLR